MISYIYLFYILNKINYSTKMESRRFIPINTIILFFSRMESRRNLTLKFFLQTLVFELLCSRDAAQRETKEPINNIFFFLFIPRVFS